MPLKRSVVAKIEDENQKTIYNFLKMYRDKVFTLTELIEVLEKRGQISAEADFIEKMKITKTALSYLIVNEKIRRFVYRGEDYFGMR